MRNSNLHKIHFCLLLVFAGIASAQTTITSQVAQGNDDAEEQVSNGNMDLGSSDLELTSDGGTNQYVGIRFQNINIPQGTSILSASIQFTTDETDTGSTSVTIRGEDTDNASIFSGSNYNISNRTLTSASAAWNNIPSWTTVGQFGTNQQTPDITTIVQEIVNRGGWSSGSAMVFVINGSGERTAESYNGDSAQSPVLTIVADFTPPPLTPLPNIVPNLNRGLPYIYYMADNRAELYAVAPDPTATPLPSPTVTNITYGGSPIIFSGEGGGYRSIDRQVYVFEGGEPTSSSDMYSIDPITGIATLVKTGIVPGHVEGAEFYINNNTGKEVLVIVYNNGTSGGADRIMAINPNAEGSQPAWSPYAGFPTVLSGARTTADGISWNPDTAEFYIQNDNNVDYYTVDITTGVTAYSFTTSSAIDGEGITYAGDGTNYIEDEDNVGMGRTIFIVNTSTGALTPAAQLGSTGDVESIMGNLGVRDDGGDAPSSYGFASHRLPILVATPVSIYMGTSQPDSEDPFMNFSTGTSDDNTGDDEDGVTSGGSDFSGQLLSLGQIKTIEITTNGSGVLSAWIDFNRDGDFDDAGEKIATDVVPSGGLITLNVSVPVTAVPGVSYARFRYSSDTGLAPGNSTAKDGEVEDYQVIIQDTISCPLGETNEEYFTYGPVYATAVIVDNSVNNQNNALGNNDGTTAQFNGNGDELILEMGENINNGDTVTVNGEDGDDFDIWVSSSATGPWTQVGVNAQLDFTFTSPINWLYIRLKRSDGAGTEDLSYVEATKSYSNFRCVPDNDGDAIPDRTDLDDDNDGILDTNELATLVSTGQPACGGETVLDFSAAANLESGTDKQIGAVYRIANITTGTDALISITDIFNATISTIDDNASDPTYFKPMTSFNFPKAGDFGYIEYNIQFVNSGGSTPVVINKFFMNFNDIDGSAQYGEQTWADNPSSYTIDNPTDLTMTQEGAWVIGTSGTAGYPGAGNVNPQVNFSVNYNSKSEMSVRVGAIAFSDGASSGGRQHSIQFNCVTNYLSPETYGLDSDSDGVANHLDLDADNDGIYDAVEAGHNLAHSNGVISSPYGLNGLADAVETSPENGTLNYSITNSDGTNPPDYLDSDSDDDGCNDANEAYGNATADSDGNGYYGVGLPPSVNPDGSVIAASYQVPADGDNNGTPDYRQAEAAPAITTQPTDQDICVNGNTSFSVAVTDVDTYQWQIFNGSVWVDVTDSGIHSGATTNTLGITNAQMSDTGNQYRVIVSNSSFICSLETSNTVALTVNQVIADAGLNQTICDGEQVTLTASASGGTPAYSYLWNTGQTTASISFTPVGDPNANTFIDYTITVTDQTGCQDTDTVRVFIESAPTATVSKVDPSCNLDNGQITFTFPDHPNRTGIEFSLDNEASYESAVADNGGSVTYGGLAVGTYNLWVRWGNNECPVDLGSFTLSDLNGVPNASTSGGDQMECAQSPIQTLTATATPPVGSNVVWFDAATGGNMMASPTLNTVGTITYYAESQDSSTGCPSDTRVPVSLTINPRPTISVTGSPTCNIFLTAYSMEVTVSTGIVTSTDGTVTNTSGNVWSISNVPAGNDIIVTVTDANGCFRDLPVTAPNCSCPVVNAPTSGGDKAFCSGDPVPPISATVAGGQTVDWYDASSGGTLLLSGSTTYTPSGAGTYYAEARNTITGCVSGSRTDVSVTEDPPSTATIGPDQTVWVDDDAVFTVSTTNADSYQWQLSTDGGSIFNNIANGTEYAGTQTTTLTVKSVEVDKNGYQYRLVALKSGSTCPPTASSSALLTVNVKTVITNRRITYRVKKN